MLCVFDSSSPSHHATNNWQQSTLVMPVKLTADITAMDTTQVRVTLQHPRTLTFEYGFTISKALHTQLKDVNYYFD